MSSSSKADSRVAYLEDAEDDTGSSIDVVEGTRKYARAGETPSSSRERPNTGKSRSERPSARKSDSSSNSVGFASSGSAASAEKKDREARRRAKEADRDQKERELRRKEKKRRDEDRAAAEREVQRAEEKEARRQAKAEVKAQEAKASRKARPSPLKHSATQPVISHDGYRRGHVDDPSHYGVQQPAVSGSRPRGHSRPASYYAGQPTHPRPPIANQGWHQAHPQPFPVGTFPPAPFTPLPGPPVMASPVSPVGVPGYFDTGMGHSNMGQDSSHLKKRFEIRPSSAMGSRPPPSPVRQADHYEEEFGPRLGRRLSQSRSRGEDSRRMPPPPFIPNRPQSAVPTTPFRPPPQPSTQRPRNRNGSGSRPPSNHRRSVGWADQPGYTLDQAGYPDADFLDGSHELFHDMSPPPMQDQRMAPFGRSVRTSGAFDHDATFTPAKHSKRSSAHGPAAMGMNSMDKEAEKYREAMAYQDDVGGSSLPFTTENLRKATKPRGTVSSRSTRSSGSRDESELKRSSVTGITRSSSGGQDDVTVKVSGAAVVRYQGAEVECDGGGGEITFSRGPNGLASDRASSIFKIEDSRSRLDRKGLPHRTRAPSQSDSQSRGYIPRTAQEAAYAAGGYI